MIRALLTKLTDPHRDCRQQHAAELDEISERDSLAGWLRGVTQTREHLADWLEQRAGSFDQDARYLRSKSQPDAAARTVAATLREAIADLTPPRPTHPSSLTPLADQSTEDRT